MIYFLAILAVPLIIAIVGFFLPVGKGPYKHIISWKEFLILFIVSVLIAGLSMTAIYYQNTTFTEMWNGIINKKQWQKVNCEHSYSCNCVTICSGGKNNSCTTICQTCYDHDFDISWFAWDTAGHTFEIDRIDRQGLKEPQRWTSIKIGDPTTVAHSYTDYIKASKGSLFRKEESYNQFQVPSYPTIYDYYNSNKILSTVPIQNIDWWQRQLALLNGRVGPSKEANVILVVVKKQDPKYYYALQQKWLNGSQNDIVVMISVDDQNNIQWANALCLAQTDLFRVKLRDSILAIGTLDMDKILKEVERNVITYFKRKDMKNFEYLRASVVPSATQLIVTMIINMLICIALTIFFYKDNTLDN